MGFGFWFFFFCGKEEEGEERERAKLFPYRRVEPVPRIHQLGGLGEDISESGAVSKARGEEDVCVGRSHAREHDGKGVVEAELEVVLVEVVRIVLLLLLLRLRLLLKLLLLLSVSHRGQGSLLKRPRRSRQSAVSRCLQAC